MKLNALTFAAPSWLRRLGLAFGFAAAVGAPLPQALAQSAVPSTTAAPSNAAQCPPAVQMPSREEILRETTQAVDRGFLWRISKGGHSSHLYGTVHAGRWQWLVPGPQVRQALLASKTVALELDVSNPAVIQDLVQTIKGTAVPLPPEQAARLTAAMQKQCVAVEAMADVHPYIRAISVMGAQAKRNGLHTEFSIDSGLAGFARSTGKTLVSLETPALQIKALLPTAQELNESMSPLLDQIESGAGSNQIERLAAAWAQAKFSDFEQMEQWCDCLTSAQDRAAMARVNDERNVPLADSIAKLHEQGPVFAAVGSLHMTGPKALQLLLAQAGFTVERIDF